MLMLALALFSVQKLHTAEGFIPSKLDNAMSLMLRPWMTAFLKAGLHRKEVIQPHLPIRLPCYDFTPIIDPTVGGFLLCRLDHRLRVLPTFVV